MDQENIPPHLRQIRTFQGDVANALQNQEESLVSIQQKEVERRKLAGLPADTEESGHKDFIFLLIGSIFFIIIGLAGAWYAYRVYIERTAPPVLSVPENRFVAPTTEVSLDASGLSRGSLAEKFGEKITNTKAGDLTHVVFREGQLETSPLLAPAGLLNLLQSQAPGHLVRAFDKHFMAGAVGESPFLIIKLSSFENAFAGMLSWEESMAEDLAAIFGNAHEVKAIAPGSVFKDVTLKNKDVRVLEYAASTTSGVITEPVLLYSFFDNNFLIITDRIEALQTLIDRLTRERLSR